ncbi:C25 family cysteine peptidase [candidate division CSSED10-310 bacterium]|uniref:C25 family cysteine peptidase n=1 Tax=candidate division CSSED10-310 bacterium TaxID=2855610 RepID=A0ABV6YZE4_UNCC1
MKYLLSIILMIVSTPLFAGEPIWYPVGQGSKNIEKPYIMTLSEGKTKISFEVDIPGLLVQDVLTKGGTFRGFALPGHTFYGQIGQARLPAIRLLVEVPHQAKINIRINEPKYIDFPLSDFQISGGIVPVQESIEKSQDGFEKWPFSKDVNYYATNEYLPQKLVQIERIDFYRSHRVALITIIPQTYNPQANRVRIYPQLSFEVQMEGGDLEKTSSEIRRTWSESFENNYANSFINYGMFHQETGSENTRASYWEGLLIISAPNLFPATDELAQWRSKMGYYVQHVDTTTTGTTKEAIKSYIQQAFDTWQNPALSFVLLVGDVAQIPSPPGTHCSNCASDSDYACLNGPDNVHDVAIGRISVEQVDEAEAIFDRLMIFTKAQFVETDWIKMQGFSSSCDDSYNGYNTHEFCLSTYTDDAGYTGTYVVPDHPGGDLIRCIEDYDYNGSDSGAVVVEILNEGRALLTYSGHCSETSWAGPYVLLGDIDGATCGERTPFMTGHCCSAHDLYTSRCFGEACIREVAVGYFGSSNSSYWGEDDYLQRAWFGKLYAEGQHKMGEYTINGLIKMYQEYSTSKNDYYMDMEILGGDPTMEIYTEIPLDLIVTHDAAALVGQTSFAVQVTQNRGPLSGARVCLTKNDGGDVIHEFGLTNAQGEVVITMNPAPAAPGILNVTVTAINAKPHEGTVNVIVPQGPWFGHDSHVMDDSAGNGDGQLNPGESINMPVTLENIGAEDGEGISGILSTTSPHCTITTDSATFPDIPTSATGLSDNPFVFDLAQDTPDGHTVNFTLSWSAIGDYNGTTGWSAVVAAPALNRTGSLVDDAVGGNDNARLDAGESAYIQVSLQNTGSCLATGVTATLSEDSPYITLDDAAATWPVIAAGQTKLSQAPHFALSVSQSTPIGYEVEFTLVINAAGGYSFSDTFSLTIGSKGQVNIVNYDSGGSDTIISNVLTQCQYTVSFEKAENQTRFADCDMLVFTCGDNTSSLSSAQIDSLIDFVNQGGKLFLEGGEIMWNHDSNTLFASTVMHCGNWVADMSGSLELAQVDHLLATTPNLLPSTLSHSYSGYGDEDAGPPRSDTTAVYTWSSYPTRAGVFAFDNDTDPANGGQIVFCSFNIATTSNTSNERDKLIENIAHWLIQADQQAVPELSMVMLIVLVFLFSLFLVNFKKNMRQQRLK